MKSLPLYLLTICFLSFNATAQKHKKPPKNSNAETEQEVKAFFKTYAEHLVQNHKEAIADLYDPSGCYILGNANKSFLSFEENKKYYLTRWTAPKSFEWNDLSIEIISPSAVVATAIFNLERSTGEKMTYSYTGLLIKQSGKWRIRVEDESFNSIGYSTKTISGDRLAPGPFRYLLTARPGASIAAHLHSADMQIKSCEWEQVHYHGRPRPLNCSAFRCRHVLYHSGQYLARGVVGG